MNNRIALVLKTKDISPSQLADELGVQRSGISHIMNGRNKPSLEFVQKLIRLYPDISMQWILFGEGPMMNPYPVSQEELSKITEAVSAEKSKPLMMELFSTIDDEVPVQASPEKEKTPETLPKYNDNQTNKINIGDLEIETGKIEHQSAGSGTEVKETLVPGVKESGQKEIPVKHETKKNPEQPEKTVRTISKILVFYSDRTFVEYHPGEE